MRKGLCYQSHTYQPLSPSSTRGFTLVEMIVSLGLFTVVFFIATSAFLTAVNADRKTQAVRMSIDNLNLALEDMQRDIRTGSHYFCGSGSETSLSAVNDCPTGGSEISFLEQDGGTRTTYRLNGGRIERMQVCLSSACSSNPTFPVLYNIFIPVTAPEINITNLNFIVVGTALGPSGNGGDTNQPYVTMMIDGSISGTAATGSTAFKIQTTVTQRDYDN